MAMRGGIALLARCVTPAALLLLALGSAPTLAADQLVLGPVQYTRTAGPPDGFLKSFTLPSTVVAPFRVHIQNGNGDGTQRVSSATITVNGVAVAGPADFSQAMAAFDRPVNLLATNTLQVRLTSVPQSFLILTLYGTPRAPTLASLEPPSLPITEGGTSVLAATISAVQVEDTPVTLTTSEPAIAMVPRTVTVPAGSVAANVPVSALSSGTATITATLNGSSLQSTVTVNPRRPTLTSLAPATLQVAEGAAGSLTVTLSAAQATDTVVTLTSSDLGVIGLPTASMTVPAEQVSQAFAVFGLSPGTATITAALNGTTAESQVSVVVPIPTIVSLLPPVVPISEGSRGALTVTLNASQPTPAEVLLSTAQPTVVALPGDRITVPANTLSADFGVIGLTRGTATISASVNGTTVTSAVEVQPPPATVSVLSCSATLAQGATSLCVVILNATQPVATSIPVTSSAPGIVSAPDMVAVPANALAAEFPVTAVAVGGADVTAGPLNGTSQVTSLHVLPQPPTIAGLTPSSVALVVGAPASLTVVLNAAQPIDTIVPLSVTPSWVISCPVSVIVPAGQPEMTVPLHGLALGVATVVAGPLNGSQAQTTVTVDQRAPTIAALSPESVTLPVGTAAVLTVTVVPVQAEATVVPISSSSAAAEVPAATTAPAGVDTSDFPVVARAEGIATVTAGPLNATGAHATVVVTPAQLVGLIITPPSPSIAKGVTQQFVVSGIYTDGSVADLTGSATWTSSDATVASIGSGGVATGLRVGQVGLTATVGGLSAGATLTVTEAVLANISISPRDPTAAVGQTLQFSATGSFTDGTSIDVTGAVAWATSDSAIATITWPGGLATIVAAGTVTVTATHAEGFTASTTLTATLPLPSDPTAVAPPVNRATPTSLATATEFLYTGPNPIQSGVAPETIDAKRVAVMRGRVLSREGAPLSGVAISILNHPEYGATLTRLDGMFDLAVNGGSQVTARYEKAGYLAAQRSVTPRWRDYAWLPDVVLIAYDTRATGIDLGAPAPMQVARGSVVTDSDGSRQATLLFAQGTTATMQLPDGSTRPLTTMTIRATEYTVGPSGPSAMPAPLPPTSAYTYAVELSADEAVTAGARSVRFSQPVIHYVENFLGFPVGGIVPVGYYDRAQAAWVPSDNGRVVKILSVTGGVADMDVTGSGTASDAATLAALGIADMERQQLAALYAAGQTLWRAPIPHFSPWDCNWPRVPPADATPPNQPPAAPERAEDKPTTQCGSAIECQNQILGETVEIVGTPFRLHYSSDRASGWRGETALRISLTGSTVPASLTGVELELEVAGRKFTQSFPPVPNQAYTFTWDGEDAYGRRRWGWQPVTIRVWYVYPNVYAQPAPLSQSFGAAGIGILDGRITRSDAPLVQEQYTSINAGWDARGQGLGGWTLTAQHVYDMGGLILYRGDGGRQSAEGVERTITTIAGTGVPGFSGDGGLATAARLVDTTGVAADGSGALFIADQRNMRIRKVSRDGIITTVAGTGSWGFSGDGGPATAAQFDFPTDVAVGRDGSLFIADNWNDRIRKVTPDGIITTVAGSARGFGGDGGPATAAKLFQPRSVAVDGEGNLFVADTGNHRIRKVSRDGIITTVAGTGVSAFSGDGGLATAATLPDPWAVAVDQRGNLYIVTTDSRIRRVSPDGMIMTVAGTGVAGFSGDGGPAIEARLAWPSDVAVDDHGSLFIADWGNGRIRNVSPGGIITTVAGTGVTGFSGDGGPATGAQLAGTVGVAVGPDGSLFFGDAGNWRLRRAAPFYTNFADTDFLIAARDGGEVYAFSASGRHLRTLHPLTGTVRYELGYDAESRLTTVIDGDGNITGIERDGTGTPLAIVAPDGQRTSLTLDTSGYLASVTNPAGESNRFTFSPDGLLLTRTTPRNQEYRFAYDTLGRLTRDDDPAGGFKTLARTDADNSYTVTLATALNRTSTYLVEQLATGGTRRIDTDPDGTQTPVVIGTDGVTTTTAPDGTVTTLTAGPDPRFGMQAPVTSARSIRTPSGLTSMATATRTATLSDPNNLLSLTTSTDAVTVNGRVSTKRFDAAQRTITALSPAGRQSTTGLDARARVVREQLDGLEPVILAYDVRGRLSTVTHGTGASARTSTLTYDTAGFLESITDPLTRTVRFAYDAAGRVTKQTLADGREIRTTYDLDGNVSSITPPSRPAHAFAYTPVDLEAEYAPPDLGLGDPRTTYAYNLDRQLTQVSRPDGGMLTLDYDGAGRLSALTESRGQTTFTYHPTTGRLASIVSPGSVGLDYAYDGSLLTSTTWVGPVAGSVTRIYDTDFRVVTEGVNGANAVTLQYDPDSLLTQAGSLTLTRSPQHGLLTGTTLNSVTEAYGYTTFGEVNSYHAWSGATPLWAMDYTRDALGRITGKTETMAGVTTTTSYAYDSAGRLSDVTQDSTLLAHYEYDGNGNRLSVIRSGSGTVSATYDAQDRLLSYGAASYTYTASGDLQTATSGGQTTTYVYDVFGNLTGATLSDGTRVEYVIDGQHRRIGKKVNGMLVQGFLYGDPLRVIAELDGSGAVVARFVYGARANVPGYMIKGGVTYRLLTDHIGSVRLVVDSATGAVAQRLDYDEFGQVTQDTNRGFQPFGFAGGLYDPDTKLTRFGARDYDAFTGRWTTRDPIGFVAGPNLYGYVGGDPVGFIDPLGLQAVSLCNDFWFPHTFLCVDGICSGKYPSGTSLLRGLVSEGRISDDSERRSKPSVFCSEVPPGNCDQASFAQCVGNRLAQRGPSGDAYNFQSANCGQWAEDVITQCRTQCSAK